MSYADKVKSRHSVRKYSDKQIDPKFFHSMFDALTNSPTWANGQEIRYTSIKSQNARQLLVEASSYNSKYIKRATELIVISAVENVAAPNDSYSHSSKEWTMFDAGIAAGQLCMIAWDEGIGSVILGDYDPEVVCKAAQLASNEFPAAIICLGYPAFEPKGPSKLTIECISRDV